jgi:glucarate dehydratase
LRSPRPRREACLASRREKPVKWVSNCYRWYQSLFHTQPHDVIEEGPFRLKDNMLDVPEGPGLGVTLSQDKLRHMHQLFIDNGPLNKYIDPAHPDRMRRLPLA